MNSFLSRLGAVKEKITSMEKGFANEPVCSNVEEKKAQELIQGLAILGLIALLKKTYSEEIGAGLKFRNMIEKEDKCNSPYGQEVKAARAEERKQERLESGGSKPAYGQCSKMVAGAASGYPRGIGGTELGRIMEKENPGMGNYKKWISRIQNAAKYGYVELRGSLIFPKKSEKVVSIKSRKAA